MANTRVRTKSAHCVNRDISARQLPARDGRHLAFKYFTPCQYWPRLLDQSMQISRMTLPQLGPSEQSALLRATRVAPSQGLCELITLVKTSKEPASRPRMDFTARTNENERVPVCLGIAKHWHWVDNEMSAGFNISDSRRYSEIRD